MSDGVFIDGSGTRRGLRDFRRGLEPAGRKLLQSSQARIAARAGSTYMRDAGAGAGPRSPQDSGPLRIVTGRLERSLRGARTGGVDESISEIETTPQGRLRLTLGSRVPYAAAHEEGFSGTVRVPSHTRTQTVAFGRPISPVRVNVRAHTKQLRIPKRSYLGPAAEQETPWVEREARRVYFGLAEDTLE